MTATLNVVVSINSTTVMQTYWTALAKQNCHGLQSAGLAENSSLAARTPRQKNAKSSYEFCKAKPAKQNCHGWQSVGLAENSSLAARTPRQKNAKSSYEFCKAKLAKQNCHGWQFCDLFLRSQFLKVFCNIFALILCVSNCSTWVLVELTS